MTDAPLPITGSIPVARGALVAVVVTRGRTPWLPATLDAIAAQTRAPTRVVVVDAAPRIDPTVGVLPADDAVARLARRALDDVAPLWTVAAPGARTFGDAVRQALAVPGVAARGLGPDQVPARTGSIPALGHANPAGTDRGAPRTGSIPTLGGRPAEFADWLWLLHDDSAPEPDALSELVRAVEHAPSVGIAGAKQRSWDDPARLLEVGLTTSRLGRRMTGVEEGEVDQGQHDGREDVLAVGLAGALVRRDVWDELDGPDPALGPFGDGLDLSRRARLAGHRVVVVPRAVVRHAQASYAGLRDDDLRHVLTGSAAHDHDPRHDRRHDRHDSRHDRPDGEDGRAPGAGGRVPPLPAAAREPDPRRSFAARRRAHVHAQLAAVPLPLLPVQTVVFLLAAVVRSLGRIAAKDGVLAAAELAAPLVAVLHPGRMARSRAAATRARRLPRRSLRVLQSTWREVYREERDRALSRAESRRLVQAPSELELAELAALASRRRTGLAALVVALAALTVTVLGPLLVDAVGGRELVGGGLLPVDADVEDLWRAVTVGWVPLGLGVAAPGDPLLAVLLPFAALTGGSAQGAVAVLFLGGLLVAGLGAWFAAGAATRSVALRLWTAAAWVAAPALQLAVDGGRLGAVVAHAALPWAALGVARALGVQRTDVVVPGLDDARTAERDAAAGRSDDAGTVGGADGAPPPEAAGTAVPVASGATALVRGASPADVPTPHVTSGPAVGAAGQGSVTAAAAAGLALAAAVAGAPVLLPAALLALVVVALAARRGRRRLVLVALPALAVAGPLLADAVTRAGAGGWRAVLAEPGLAVGSTAAPAWQQLLAWPTPPAADLAGLVGAGVAAVAPFVLGATVTLLAVLALLRGRSVARGVRAGWAVAACGLAAAVVTGRVATAVVDGSLVRGWPGAGVSLALLGLLTAATLGADGTRDRMARHTFGWRQVVVAVLTGLAALAPLVPLAEWVVRTRPAATAEAGGPGVDGVEGPVVPAVGQQAQTSEARSRVLTLGVVDSGEVRYGLLRGDGPQLTERSAAAVGRAVGGAPYAAAPAPADDATREVEALVARIATGAAGDVSGDLGALAVAAVLVPPAEREADERARSELVGRLDATGGLERITESPTGVIWRVVAPAADAADQPAEPAEPAEDAEGADDGDTDAPDTAGDAPVTAWARLLTPGATPADPATVTPLAAGPLTVRTTVPAGEAGRTVVLAERADAGWRAWLDGRRLRAVDAGWRQAFEVGVDGGRLTVAYAPPGRAMGWTVQAVVIGLTVLLALPVRRRRGGPR